MKYKRRNWLKKILQWGTLLIIACFILWGIYGGGKPTDPEAYCPFGGLQVLSSFFINNTLACGMTFVQIMMGIALTVGVLLFSKLFCGYLCPLGTVSEWLSRVGSKTGISYTISKGSFADLALRTVKYGLLFFVFYFTIKSSELFCMKFDPYYAVATGFTGEATLWMSLAAIALLIFGNLYFKMFWCKYICPLGALSNLLRFTLLFVGMIGLIWGFEIADFQNGWVLGLGIACLLSYIFEITCLKNKTWSLLRIVRNEKACTSCKECAKKCPYSIDVNKTEKVKDVDCTLCGDCVSCCPDGALMVSKRKSFRFFPILFIVVLFSLAITFGRNWELPTIDNKWGAWEQVSGLKTFELDGMISVKCYASAMAFATKVEQIPGVYGTKAYVGRHTVVLTYDPAMIDTFGIQKALFTPVSMKFCTPDANSDSLRIIQLGVDGLFERMDAVYLGNILRKFEGIYGFETHFDHPVVVKLYTDPTVVLNEETLKDSIQAKGTSMLNHEGASTIIPINYKLLNYNPNAGKVAPRDFIIMIFDEMRTLGGVLKDNMAKYGDDEIYPKGIYQIFYPDIEKPPVKSAFPYFKSFLSTLDGITSIDVELDNFKPVLRIIYVKNMWNDDRIWKDIFNAPVWTIKYMDGSTKEELPRLTFQSEGFTIE
ncbi:MAG: 4Fe-4S binding protein [Prevotellaceae bacterium]|jgi:polyferredoxin|nr:4Fe-4S binding protein [Prevotellaceae bacterium]